MEGVIPRHGASFQETMQSIAAHTQATIDENAPHGLSASIGHAHFEPGMSAEELYKLADAKMYEVKQAKST